MAEQDFSPAPGYTLTGFQSAAGISTIGQHFKDRTKKCIAKDHTCNGWRAKGTKFCIGHLRKLGLIVDEPEVLEVVEVTDDDAG